MRKRKPQTDCLPFVGTATDSKRKSFWNLQDQGDFAEGARTGAAMAAAYRNYLASQHSMPPSLPQIVMDITGATGLSDAKHGQLIGFFSVIEEALKVPRAAEGNHGEI